MVAAKINELLITPKFANQSDYIKVWQNANNKVAETLKKKLGTAIGSAVGSGFSIQAADRYGERLTKQATKLFDLQEAQDARKAKFEQELQANLLNDKQKEEARQQVLRSQKEIDSLENKFKREVKQAEDIGEAIADSASKGLRERTEEAAASFADAFQDFMSKDIGRLGERIKKMGQGAAVAGSKMGDTGIGRILGPVLSKLGSVLKLIGPLLVAFGSLATVIFEADAALKALNQELFSSGAAAAELTDQFGSMEDALDNVRNAFSGLDGFNFNRLYGITAKENAQIIGQFAAGGQVYAKLTAGITDAGKAQERLRDATETTLIYSKLFGEEAGAMTERISDYMESLGYSLESVAQSLSSVHMQAMQSGFGIKRFFTLLNQATADMSMYNVRLEEAGMLLTKLGKAVGPKAAGAQLQSLTKGFGDENIQSRIKRIVTTPGFQDLYQKDMEASAAVFIRNLSTARGGGVVQGLLEETLGGPLKPGELVGKLGAMSPDEQAMLLAEAQKSGNDDLVRSLSKLMKGAGGATGTMEGMVKGMGTLGMGAKLVALMTQGQEFLGNTPLYKMSMMQLAAFENATGISGEQLEVLKEVSLRTQGSFLKLQKLVNEGVVVEPNSDMDKMLAEQYGATIRNGKILQAQLVDGKVAVGNEIQNANDLLIMDAKMQDAIKAGVDQDKLLAQQMSNKVTEISKILEQGVEAILLRIAGAVDNIWGAISMRTLDEGEKKRRQDLIDVFRKRDENLAKEQETVLKDLSRVTDNLATARASADTGSITRLEDEKKRLEDKDAAIRTQRDLMSKAADKARQVKGGRIFDETTSQMQEQIVQSLIELPEFKGKGDEIRRRLEFQTYDTSSRQSAVANDFLLQVGANGRVKFAQRVDNNDVAVLSKSGGALDQASRSAAAMGSVATTGPGGVTNVFHLYNDAPGMVRAIAQAQRAGVI